MTPCLYCNERPADGPDGLCREDRIAHGESLIESAHATRHAAAELLYPKLGRADATAKLRAAGWSDAALITSRILAFRAPCANCGEPLEDQSAMKLSITTQSEPYSLDDVAWTHDECPDERPKDDAPADEPHGEPPADETRAPSEPIEPERETKPPKHETSRAPRETKPPKHETAHKPRERHAPKPKTGHRRK